MESNLVYGNVWEGVTVITGLTDNVIGSVGLNQVIGEGGQMEAMCLERSVVNQVIFVIIYQVNFLTIF